MKLLQRFLRAQAHTLRRRLLLALLLPLVAVTAVGACVDYFTARQLTRDSYDRTLAATAIGLAARVESDRDDDLPAHLSAAVKAVNRITADDDLYYLVIDAQGHSLSGDPRLAALTQRRGTTNPFFHDAELEGTPVRAVTYDYAGPDGRARIIVAETLGRQGQATQRMLWLTMAINLAMALAVVVIAVLAVRLALRPLDSLGALVEARQAPELHPIEVADAPAETQPLVHAINRLMERVQATVQARQMFINNTAHQLRTPLAGLTAHVELLTQEALPPAANARAQAIQHSVQQLSHLTNQMLALARATEAPPAQHVNLPELLQEVALACLDAAIARQIDLGFDAAPASVQGSAWMLREMLLNLVNNAVMHNPAGTVITARCGEVAHDGACVWPDAFIEVEDNGMGIAPADRERVFERFVRLSQDDHQHGTGLGLAIVKEIAQHHGAKVQMLDGRSGRGTRVLVVFPG